METPCHVRTCQVPPPTLSRTTSEDGSVGDVQLASHEAAVICFKRSRLSTLCAWELGRWCRCRVLLRLWALGSLGAGGWGRCGVPPLCTLAFGTVYICLLVHVSVVQILCLKGAYAHACALLTRLTFQLTRHARDMKRLRGAYANRYGQTFSTTPLHELTHLTCYIFLFGANINHHL